MKLARAMQLFSGQPWASLLLAALFVLVGVAFVAGWVPASSIPRYLPGHEAIMAVICGVAAAFFAYCAVHGWRRRKREPGE